MRFSAGDEVFEVPEDMIGIREGDGRWGLYAYVRFGVARVGEMLRTGSDGETRWELRIEENTGK